MREPTYAVYPGVVRSQTDGQYHHVGAGQLCRLYGVDIRDCLVVTDQHYNLPHYRGYIERASKLPGLFPRYGGNYTIPKGPR